MSVPPSDQAKQVPVHGPSGLKALRASLGHRFLRLAFQVLKPKRLYVPVEIGGRRFANKREADNRWAAIASAIRGYSGRSVLDIGCAEGWFIRRAAADLGCFAIGVEAEDRRVLVGETARLHDGVERVAVIKARLAPDDIRHLPPCDIVMCLSVIHHVIRDQGLEGAEAFIRALASRANKAVIFEVGTSDEKELSWTKVLPDMPEGQEAFVRQLLETCGLTNIRVIGSTPGLKGDTPRLLFSAEPA
jgi:SAM-dependent methyltransferase